MVQLGFIEELLESEDIWNCAQCLTCKERCPRDVAPYDIIQALQNLAFYHNKFFPKDYSIFINSILKEGAIKKSTRVRIRKNSSIENKTKRVVYFADRNSLNLTDVKKIPKIAEFAIALKKALKGEER